ncbi:MAG: hypothetical protein ABWK02_06265 [Aquificaceae bacterium]
MGVLCLLLDKRKQYFPLLVDIFNVTGHKLLVALEEEKAFEFLRVSSPEVLLLSIEDMDFWFKVLKLGKYITPIFFIDRYEEADKLKEYGLRDVNYVVLPFNPMELLTKIVSISKDIYEQAHLEYLGPINLLLKFLSLGKTLILTIEDEEGKCSLYLSKGAIKGSSCDIEKFKGLITKEVRIKLEPYKEEELPYKFKDNWDFISSIIYSHIPEHKVSTIKEEAQVALVEAQTVPKYKVDLSQAIELKEGLYWVGVEDNKGLFQKNSYLRIYEKDSIKVPILINVGTHQDYALIRTKLEQVVGTVDAVKGLILMGSGLDEASGVVNFLQSSQRAFVITSLNIAQKLKALGIPLSRIKTIETFPGGRLKLATGDILRFISTPFLPEAGSFVVLEESKGYLFTGKFLSSLRSIEEFNPLTDTEIEDLLLYTSLHVPSQDVLSFTLKKIVRESIACVYPMFGNPMLSESLIKEAFSKLSSIPNNFHEFDEGVILEVCESLLKLLKKRPENDEIISFFEELNQFMYIEDTKIHKVFVDIERLPSLMLGLMFNKNLEPNLIKEAIKHFYLAGIKLTI